MKNGMMRRSDRPALESNWAAAGQFVARPRALPLAESDVPRAWQGMKNELAEVCAACGAFEWLALSYLAATSLLMAIFAGNLAHPFRLLAAQVFVAAVVLTLCRIERRAASRGNAHDAWFSAEWWHFWRYWYPHLFFLFCFEELAHLMTLVTPNWQDGKLMAFDHWLTGVQPSVWLEQFATPFRNDAMQLVYFSYFAYLLMVGGVLYFRRDWRGYWSVMTYSISGYMIGYLIAMFFPVESPWFSMAGCWNGPLAGGPFTAMMSFIEHYGRVRGAAFPSAHVTGATAALWGAWKFRRWLFWALLPCYAGMCLSTVWGRYHYCADVFGGFLTGTLGYLIGSWFMRGSTAVPAAGPAASV